MGKAAQDVSFLKELYRKEEVHEKGGNSLDLLNPALTRKYGQHNTDAFLRDMELKIRLVQSDLEKQKNKLTTAFIDSEFERARGRSGAKKKQPSLNVERLKSQRRDKNQNLDEECKLLEKQVKALKTKLGILNITKEENSLLCMEQKRAQTAISSSRMPSRMMGYGDVDYCPSFREKPYILKHAPEGKNGIKKTKKRRNVKDPNTRLRERSELQKRAQNISKAQAFQYLNQSRWTTLKQQDYLKPTIGHDPEFANFHHSDTIMTKYADAISKSPDLRGIF